MHLHRSYTLFLLSVALLANAAPAPEAIVVPPSPMPLTDLAARELQRYLYLLSGELLPIRENCEGSCFAVDGPTVNPLVRELVADKALSWNPGRLGDQGYILSTVQHKGRTVTVAAGATPLATMYAVYDLLERYGFGFYLGGDALPEPRPLAFLELNDVCVPRFRIRGSLPWYNFLNSPTTWNLADHRRFYDQMAKMRMNFVGFHAYDYEPFTAVQLDGHWQFGQPLQNTRQNVWGALPMRTEEWGFGTSECFHREYFGADASLDYESFDEGITKAQRLLANGLAYARQRGIHVCVGFEVHGDPGDPRNEMILEQRLRHLLATYPMIEYVWLWQAEGRGHGGDQPTPPRSTPFGNYYWQVRPAFEYLRQPQRIAEAARVSYYAHLGHRILRHFAPGVRLIVSGWGGDHWMRFSDFYVGMDKVLPEDVIFAALDNIDPSWSPEVSRAYGELSPSRERWPIPWFESDGGGSRRDQWGPQCNVKPFTELCRDALNKGCQGLLGIHWRTGGVEEVAAYVAQFAWNPELTYEDFYRGFAQRCFGPELAEEMGAILRQLESLGPRWTGALGQVECGGFQWFSSEHRPKPQNLQTLAAIEARLLTLRERIAPRHRDRLDYLIHMIRWVTRYDAAALQLQPGGPVEQAIAAAEAAQAAGAENAEELAKAALAALRSSGFGEALAERARLLRDQGDMGVLATVNGKAYAAYRALESRIAALLPQALPPEPPVLDDLELAVTVTPDRLYAAEPLTVQAIVRSDRPPVLPALCWRPLGSREEYRSVSMERLGRSVFAATVPAAQLEEPGVEFYVEAADAAGRHKRLPAAGPDGPWSACVVPYAVTRWPVPQPAPESGAACLALTAQSVGPFQVQLSWRPAPGTSPHHWEVRRRSGTDPTAGPTLIGEPRLPGFTDFRAASNRLHTYSVRPVLWNGATGEESTTEITTPQYPPPAAPKELTGTPGVRSALLRWGGDEPGIESYRILRTLPGHRDPTVVAEVPATGATQAFIDRLLPPNQNVTYRVLAVALDGSASEPSAPVTLRPLQAPTPVISLPLKGTLDEASGLHPQVHGAPSFETINERKVLRLGPGRWLAFEDRPEFDIPCEITLEAWVRFDDLSGMPVLIGHSRWMERGYFLQVLGGAVRFHLALEGGGLNADAGRIAPGQWVHIVGTFDGDVARVYVNGEQVGAFQRPNSLAPFIVPYSGPLYIGRYHEESPMYEVHGCLGGVAVFNGALSAETVRARFDAGL